MVLGLLAAYAFSRYDIPGKGDWLFFILSTRMLPAVVVTIPIFLMYRALGLYDTHIGMILLYTVFNLSFSVWLLKGFIDEIPNEYEEAALVDGYSRLQAFRKIVLPQCVTGIAATAVFCLIFAWNEFAFALMLTSAKARTAPPSIATILGVGGIEWGVHCSRLAALPDPGRHRHLRAAQVPAARRHLRRDPQVEPGYGVTRHGEIELKQVAKKFGESWAVKPMDLTISRRRVRRAARPVGLRQDDDAAHDLRAGSGHRRADLHRRQGCHLADRQSQRDIAFVFQFFALYPQMTRAAEHRLPAGIAGHVEAIRSSKRRGRSGRDAAHRATCSSRSRAALSGGDKQRVALARSLVRRRPAS